MPSSSHNSPHYLGRFMLYNGACLPHKGIYVFHCLRLSTLYVIKSQHHTFVYPRSPTMLAILIAIVFSRIVATLVPTTWNGRSYECKCYVGDDCWPKAEEWSALNGTLGGNLAVHIPPGAVCHNAYQGPLGNITTFNQAACSNVQQNFQSAQWA